MKKAVAWDGNFGYVRSHNFMKARTINPKLADFIESEWNPYIRQAKMSWKVDERIARDHIVPYFEGRKLKDISSEGVKVWYHFLMSKGLAISTCNRILYVLKNIFKFAVGRGFFEKSANPLQDVHWVKTKKERPIQLENKVVHVLYDSLLQSDRMEANVILLMLYTGASKSEIIRARWNNYFPEKNLLLIRNEETRKIKKLWLSEEAKDLISSRDETLDSPWIFPGRDKSKPLSDIFLFWDELRKQFDLKFLKINEYRDNWLRFKLSKGMTQQDHCRLEGNGKKIFGY